MKELKKIEDINYVLDIGKRRNSYIQIRMGIVIVKVPKHTSMKYVDDLLLKKMDWIKHNLQIHNSSKKNILYEDGALIPILGNQLTIKLEFNDAKRSSLKIIKDIILISLPINYKNLEADKLKLEIKKNIDKLYNKIAQEEVILLMDEVTSMVGLNPKEIYIKNLKSTWGICSSKRYISINQNLMMFSKRAIKYVCLHEVCHLKYMNHSKEFWNMVEYYMPDYKLAKKELKGYD